MSCDCTSAHFRSVNQALRDGPLERWWRGGGGGAFVAWIFFPCELAVQEIFLWFINLFFFVARSCSISPPPLIFACRNFFLLWAHAPPPSPITFSNGPASRQDRVVYATVWYFLQYWKSRLNQKPACLRSRPHLVRLLVWPSYLIRNWARSFSSTSRLQQSDHAQKRKRLSN